MLQKSTFLFPGSASRTTIIQHHTSSCTVKTPSKRLDDVRWEALDMFLAETDRMLYLTNLLTGRLKVMGVNYTLYSGGEIWSELKKLVLSTGSTLWVSEFPRTCWEPVESEVTLSSGPKGRRAGQGWKFPACSAALEKHSTVQRK